MSRSLGGKIQHKAAHKKNSYEERGRLMFERGEPCPPSVKSRGKDHAKYRGWQRAAMAARAAQGEVKS